MKCHERAEKNHMKVLFTLHSLEYKRWIIFKGNYKIYSKMQLEGNMTGIDRATCNVTMSVNLPIMPNYPYL